MVAHYVSDHDVPEADVAAALAVVAQGDTPAARSSRRARAHAARASPARATAAGVGRPRRSVRAAERAAAASPMATYRIAVGKRHKVEPRQIVGAIANEGGLSRGDFGHIQIRPDFSLVELPAELTPDALEKLSSTRISGKLIDIRADGGPRAAPARLGRAPAAEPTRPSPRARDDPGRPRTRRPAAMLAAGRRTCGVAQAPADCAASFSVWVPSVRRWPEEVSRCARMNQWNSSSLSVCPISMSSVTGSRSPISAIAARWLPMTPW